MTREQNIKAILECVFSESKEELIDIAVNKIMAIKVLEQEPCRDTEEIAEVIKSDVDAEIKCKMISNILTAKPHYFKVSQEPIVEKDPCETCGYSEGSPFCLQYCPYDAERKKEQEPCDDAISREAILSKIKEVCFSKEWKWVQFRINNGSNGQRDFLIDYIEQLPPVTPSKRKGHWVHKGQGIYCSECGEESGYNPFGASRFSDYCPSCGVEMEGTE